MRTFYVKAKDGRFRGSLPRPRSINLTRPKLPHYPMPLIPPDSLPIEASLTRTDVERWDLSTAKDVGLPEERRYYRSEQEKSRAKNVAIAVFVGIQAGYVGSVTALHSALGGSPLASVITVLGLPVAIALASLPAREYQLVKNAKVVNHHDKS